MNRGIGMSLQIEEEIGKDLVGPLEEMIVKKAQPSHSVKNKSR